MIGLIGRGRGGEGRREPYRAAFADERHVVVGMIIGWLGWFSCDFYGVVIGYV